MSSNTITPITLASGIAPVVIIVPEEQAAEIKMIEAEAQAFKVITTQDEATAADALVARAIQTDKAIEKRRQEVKAPILELGRLIDEAAGEARTAMTTIKMTVGRAVANWNAAENERRARLRREQEERDRQAAEAARLAAEAAQRQRDAEEAAARAAREAAGQEDPDSMPPAEALADADDAPPAEAAAAVRAAEVRPALVLPPPPMSVTVEEREAARPVRTSSVKIQTRKTAEITNPDLLLAEALKSGGVINGLQVLAINDAAVKKAALTGINFPGVTVTTREIVSAK